MGVIAFLALRYDLAVDALRPLPGHPAPVRAVLEEASDGIVRDGYRLLEPQAPRAAVALLGAYTGERLLDVEVTQIDLAGGPAVLRLPQPARNLSKVEAEAGVACRWVRDRDARLFLPLAWEGGVLVIVRARPLETAEPQFVEAFWNDVGVGRLPMTPEWSDYRFDVPKALVRLGTNVLALQFDRAPIYRRTRGVGPREVRPAALAAITLHRAREVQPSPGPTPSAAGEGTR
jgi:hypothetical protein